MKIGLCVPIMGQYADRRALKEFAIRAEAAGFDSLWVQEHFMWRDVPKTGYAGAPGVPMPKPYQSMLQPLETLSFCAAVTEKVQLGTSILVTAYHRPLMLARRMATLDVISGGRALCGLGLGWMAEEYEHMDTPFKQRGARYTDFVKAMKAGWAPDPVNYDGPYFNFPECHSSPKPLQRDENGNPCVPILTGGANPLSLERCAEFAQGWNPAGTPAAVTMQIKQTLDGMVKAKGRNVTLPAYLRIFAVPTMPGVDPGDPGFFGRMAWMGDADAMAKKTQECVDAGIDHIIIETNFWEQIPSSQNWIDQVDFFAPCVDVAHAGA